MCTNAFSYDNSADVIHPAPGADGRPSFTALVGNVDSDTAKYVAECRVQTSRQEMIDDLEDMALKVLGMYRAYRTKVERKSPDPKRIIFYRDGVSEGQFQHVLDFGQLLISIFNPFSLTTHTRAPPT